MQTFEITIGDKTFQVDSLGMFDIFFSESPLPNCILDSNGALRQVNPAMLHLFGFEDILDFENKLFFSKNNEEEFGYKKLNFKAYTKKNREVGGSIILSKPFTENLCIGFLKIERIEGLEEFAQILDKANQYLNSIDAKN